MRLLSRRTPLFVGALVAAALTGLLVEYSPQPGTLSSAHAEIVGAQTIDACGSCHAGGALAENCLRCHEEIATQLRERRGYHSFLLDGEAPRCTPCHTEHHGAEFPLTSEISWGAQVPRAFRHPQVEFALEGKHTNLACEACHLKKYMTNLLSPSAPAAFRAVRRQHTFLGLTQECKGCHEDPHAGGLSWACGECHGQDGFSPTPHFDHGVHFPLDGGHRDLACLGCHAIPPAKTPSEPRPFPFGKVRGKTCEACHTSPHRAQFAAACEACHPRSDPQWTMASSQMTAEVHASTGFALAAPHDRVACRDCHPPGLPYDERHPDPSAPAYRRLPDTCEGCHPDAHAGQFLLKHPRCLDCHERHSFAPARFGRAEHAAVYPLTGGHEGVPCTSCHLVDPQSGARRFAGNRGKCRDCHESPHGDQFLEAITAEDCSACHREAADTFRIEPFDHAARTGYRLEGAHAATGCKSCHVEVLAAGEGGPARVRRYRGTPAECSGCHSDIHRGQFAAGGQTECAACHGSFTSWEDVSFDHDSGSRFPLAGVHARVACSRCHPQVELEDGARVVHYKPLGRECRDCHEIPQSPTFTNGR